MRVLVGNIIQIPELLQRLPLPGRESAFDDIIAYGPGYPQTPMQPQMSFAQIHDCCPPGWKPDVAFHWSPEYNPVPEGIERADCLTVGVFGDWNLGGQAIRHIGSAFDVLFADKPGCERLRQAGFENVHYARLFAYDPRQHRCLPHTQRDIDILMIGNFNHALQQERSLWLARVARLSRKYRVVLTSGLFGEAYVEAMNRAKIVFNRSIRGEINMRAHEATACGALTFYERENPEIRDLFTDKQECILYGEDDLEALLDYYLAPENSAERERVAQAGWERVQGHTYARYFGNMLNVIAPQVEAWKARTQEATPRVFAQKQQVHQHIHRAAQWILSGNPALYPQTDALLLETTANTPQGAERTEIAALHAVLLGEWANVLPPSPERERRLSRALLLAQQAVYQEPDYALGHCNLGFLSLLAGQPLEAETALRAAVTLLEASDLKPSQLRGLVFPRRYDFYTVSMERVYSAHTPGSTVWCEALRPLLMARIRLSLAEAALSRDDFAQALHQGRHALTAVPDLGPALALMARSLRALGRTEEALATYRQTLKQMPFELSAWDEAARLYLDLNRPAEAVTLLDDLMTFLNGCPFYAQDRPHFESLHYQARQMAAQPAPFKSCTCLLAFPDWKNPEQWQGIVGEFVSTHRPSDPVLLMLRADPEEFPDTSLLLWMLETYLTQNLHLPRQALPNITLLNQSLSAADRWKLFHVADAFFAQGETPPSLRNLAEATGTPLWTPVQRAA